MARRTAGVVSATRKNRLQACRAREVMHELRFPDLSVKRN
jgi:hypothetical protein